MAVSLLHQPGKTTKRWVFERRGQLVAASAFLGFLVTALHQSRFALPGTPLPWVALGGFLVCLGIATRIWASFHIGGRKNRQVVQSGPFA